MQSTTYTPGHSENATEFMARRTIESHGEFVLAPPSDALTAAVAAYTTLQTRNGGDGRHRGPDDARRGTSRVGSGAQQGEGRRFCTTNS